MAAEQSLRNIIISENELLPDGIYHPQKIPKKIINLDVFIKVFNTYKYFGYDYNKDLLRYFFTNFDETYKYLKDYLDDSATLIFFKELNNINVKNPKEFIINWIFNYEDLYKNFENLIFFVDNRRKILNDIYQFDNYPEFKEKIILLLNDDDNNFCQNLPPQFIRCKSTIQIKFANNLLLNLQGINYKFIIDYEFGNEVAMILKLSINNEVHMFNFYYDNDNIIEDNLGIRTFYNNEDMEILINYINQLKNSISSVDNINDIIFLINDIFKYTEDMGYTEDMILQIYTKYKEFIERNFNEDNLNLLKYIIYIFLYNLKYYIYDSYSESYI